MMNTSSFLLRTSCNFTLRTSVIFLLRQSDVLSYGHHVFLVYVHRSFFVTPIWHFILRTSCIFVLRTSVIFCYGIPVKWNFTKKWFRPSGYVTGCSEEDGRKRTNPYRISFSFSILLLWHHIFHWSMIFCRVVSHISAFGDVGASPKSGICDTTEPSG